MDDVINIDNLSELNQKQLDNIKILMQGRNESTERPVPILADIVF